MIGMVVFLMKFVCNFWGCVNFSEVVLLVDGLR